MVVARREDRNDWRDENRDKEDPIECILTDNNTIVEKKTINRKASIVSSSHY